MGPDAYGYYIYDNTDGAYLSAPVYNWAEVYTYPSSRITFPGTDTDDNSTVISLPFGLHYYGHNYGYALVSINGFIAFDTTQIDNGGNYWTAFDNSQIPEPSAPYGLIAPFWDDLEYSGLDGVFRYYDSTNHRFIIEWKNCTHAREPNHHPETFEMIIYDENYYPTPTGDCEIVFQYQTVYNDDNDTYNSHQPGLYCTVGMQNFANNDGLQYSFDNFYHPAASVLQAGRAIKITTVTGMQQPPEMAYDPHSFIINAQTGHIVLDTLTISNIAGGLLNFTLNEFTDNGRLAKSGDNSLGQSESAQQDPISILHNLGSKTGDENVPIYPPVVLNHGGPDTFGNSWVDSDDPGGPTYNWIDISGSGTLIPFVDDDASLGPYAMGFSFPFYGTNYSSVYVCPNGIITFGSGTNSWENINIPNDADPNNFIAALWDDLSPQNGGSCYYYHDVANGRFIVSFSNTPFYSGGGNLNFEFILYSNGRILLEFGDIDGGSRGLAQLTIGIENNNGNDGLQVAYNADYLHSNMAILFYPPAGWLASNLHYGSITAGGHLLAIITFDASDLTEGVYTGHLDLDSNDPARNSIDIPVTLNVGQIGPQCPYVIGDINNNGVANGIDVVYGVGYFKGGPVPPVICSCPPHGDLYVAGDVNGSCVFNGIDITYFVAYLKGGSALRSCPDCPPDRMQAPLAPSVIPSNAPILPLKKSVKSSN
jgi:hypothetical protein